MESLKSCFLVFYSFFEGLQILSVQVGKTDDAREIIRNLWGESEVERAIAEFQAVIKDDGSDLDSSWLELLEEPHSRGCIKVVFRFQILKELAALNLYSWKTCYLVPPLVHIGN